MGGTVATGLQSRRDITLRWINRFFPVRDRRRPELRTVVRCNNEELIREVQLCVRLSDTVLKKKKKDEESERRGNPTPVSLTN